jgi:lysophospholipase L1-like esterase
MCEPQVADYIAARSDWDVAVLEMGANMFGEFSTQEFQKRVEYFIPTIAEAHPASYVFCVDIFPCHSDLDAAATKHREFRRIVRQTAEKLNLINVVYLDATTMLHDLSGLSTDLTHPAPAGMEEIAQNLARQMSERMKR